MKKLLLVLLLCAAAVSAEAQNVSLVGAGGASLRDLAGTTTLVTVVLDSGAQDPNLRVAGVTEDYAAFVTEEGRRTTYLYGDITEVRVQGGKVQEERFKLSESRALTPDQQRVLEQAYERARQIFEQAQDMQQVRIAAAALLATEPDLEALEYLRKLIETNDLVTQLTAAGALYAAGEEVPENIVLRGLKSGNRAVRLEAAMLAGNMGLTQAIPDLREMLRIRGGETAAVAALALGDLNERDVIPQLINMLGDRNEVRGEAAVSALSKLGGQNLIEQLEQRVERVEGTERLRIAKILHRLDAPVGKRVLREIFRTQPTLKLDAAIPLAIEGDYNAASYLRQRLTERVNETPDNLLRQAQMAHALVLSGDITAMAKLQELLASDNPGVRLAVIFLLMNSENRAFFTALEPNIQSPNPGIALMAALAAGALANPQFRDRLLMDVLY